LLLLLLLLQVHTAACVPAGTMQRLKLGQTRTQG